MQLSVITDEIDPGLTRALDVCAELGIGAVELRTIDGVSIVDQPAGALERICAELDARGVRVSAIASPFLKCDRDQAGPEQDRINERAIEVALALSAPIVRAFSFWRQPDPRSVLPELGTELRQAAARAQAAGVTLALENEHECNVANSAEAAAALDAAGSPDLRLIWDAGNAAMLDPEGFVGLGGLEAIFDRVAHVHLKDADAAGNWVRIGDGIVDHTALLRFLQSRGYDGYLSFETHYQLDGSGERATRACVASLREIAQDADVALG